MKFSEKVFLYLPLPLSKWMYRLSRKFIYDKRFPEYGKAVKLIGEKNIKGDYLEFGVYKGSSLIEFSNLFKKFGLNETRLFAFDGFQGLPSSEGKVFKKGEYYFPKKSFIRRVKNAGVDLKKLIIIEGFFNVSLTENVKQENKLTKASIIHIDCDLYESVVDVLKFCQNLIQEGTVLIFDDYSVFQNETDPSKYGEQRAFKEWALFPLFKELYEIGNSKAFVYNAQK